MRQKYKKENKNKSDSDSKRRIEIVSRLTDDNGKILFDINTIPDIIKKHSCIEKYAYIIHDKDVYTEEDELAKPDHKKGTLKPPHIHLYLHFNSPQHIPQIAKWFNIEKQFLEVCHGREIDVLAYLVHLTPSSAGKYQYNPLEIVSNFDVQGALCTYSARRNNTLHQADIDLICQKIMSGEICEYNKVQMIGPQMLFDFGYKIDRAFKIQQETFEENCKNRDTLAIYIEGPAQVGKTTFAKTIAKDKSFAYYISSSSNDLLGDYKQEPAVILDDLRPDSIGISDLLKLLDNHTASTFKSRYKNKYLNCRIIIITSTLEISRFFEEVAAGKAEPIEQLKRRCRIHIRMNEKKIYISCWDAAKKDYVLARIQDNDIPKFYHVDKELSRKEINKFVDDIIPRSIGRRPNNGEIILV